MMCLYLQLTVTEINSSFVNSDSERQSLATALFSGIESSSASTHNVLEVIFHHF